MSERLPPTPGRARVHGAPGTSPRLRGFLRALLPLAGAAVAAGWLLRAAWPAPALPPGLAALLLALLAAGAGAWLVRSQARLHDYERGARGEQRAAFALAGLDGRFDIFHGLPLAGEPWSDCDHIVVGPTGVFVIETKNWSAPVSVRRGEILYGGRRPDRPPLPQVRRAAAGLRAALARELRLDLEIRPVLCFAGEGPPDAVLGLQGVIVCRVAALRGVLLGDGGPPLGEADRARVAGHLRRLSEAG